LLPRGSRRDVLPRDHAAMRIVIRGENLPGRHFLSDGRQLDNVHVAVQEKRDPVGLVRGDAASARWDLDVTLTTDRDGALDFRGPAVQGTRGERFLYLTWGDVGDNDKFAMFRRAKLMLHRVDPALVHEADTTGRPLEVTVDLTDDHGCPRCARVDPPALTWSVAPA
jgi:hypothetical protein